MSAATKTDDAPKGADIHPIKPGTKGPKYLYHHQAQLCANGYDIVPIKPGKKAPTVKGWPTTDFCSVAISDRNNAGVGIKTENTPAIDVDVTDNAMLEKIDKLIDETLPAGELLRRKGAKGFLVPCKRDGDAFKKLNTGKWVDDKGTAHGLEILATGQQFVAHHIHPGTKKPYAWPDGDLTATQHDDLPPLSLETARDILNGVLALFDEQGWTKYKEKNEGGIVTIRKPGNGRRLVSGTEGTADPVMVFLHDKELIQGDMSPTYWLNIQCPWWGGHDKTLGKTAGYRPLGYGDSPDTRAFKCLHDSCSNNKTPEFLTWLAEHGGPDVTIYDPCGLLIERYALVEAEGRVFDLLAGPDAPHHAMSTARFKESHHEVLHIDPKTGRKTFAHTEWLESPNLKKLRGHIYAPGRPLIIENRDGLKYLNSYRPPKHDPATGDPGVFLDHVQDVLPNEGDAELFLDWLAFKLQNPGRRAYSMLIVAKMFGIGRSVIAKIINRLAQGGTATISFDDLIGKDGQAQFNEWADSNQFIIVNEVKQADANWTTDHRAYEAMKEIMDDSPVYGMRVKMKYGGIFNVDFYANFLLFSNHENAVQLPEDDRRFCVLRATDVKRSPADYAAIHALHDDTAGIAQLYHWLMKRDVSAFTPNIPPMNQAKQTMIEQGRSLMDELMDAALESLAGDVATEKQILDAGENVATEQMHMDLAEVVRARKVVRMAIKRLSPIGDERSRLSIKTGSRKYRRVPARVIRNVLKWRGLADNRKMHLVVEEARKNGVV